MQAREPEPGKRPLETRPMGKREVLALFAIAIVLRLAVAILLDTPGQTARGVWEWGYEAGCIATSLHEGQGYANTWTRPEPPWDQGSGPTGWLSPAYPALLAVLLDLTGGLTRATGWLLVAIQTLLSALTCLMTAGLGARLEAPRAGRIAAWALAVHPLSIWHATATVWDTTLAAFAFTAVMTRLAACERHSGRRGWTTLGLVFGLALLVNAAPIAALPVVAWVAMRSRRGFVDWLGAFAPFLLATGAIVLPWMLRNASAVGTFALRTNLGVELYVGNFDGADGRYHRDRHPSHSAAEFERYRALGEMAYADWAGGEAWRWIGENPGAFAVLSPRRAQTWWIGEDPWTDPRREGGLSAREDPRSWIKWVIHFVSGALGLAGAGLWARARREPRPYLLLLFLVPPVYWATHVMERYRWPIEPLLVLAAAWLVSHWMNGRAARAAAH